MAKELERLGLPVALFSAIPAIPVAFGAPRIIPVRAIRHPLGDAALPVDRERQVRRVMVEAGLSALGTRCERPTLFPAV